MKTICITLLACIINCQIKASASECPLSSLSADQKKVLIYFCWKPFLKESAQTISLPSYIQGSINKGGGNELVAQNHRQATIPHVLLDHQPLRSYIRSIDANTHMATVSGFPSLSVPFDDFLPTVVKGKELFDSQGYDIFDGSCITIEKQPSA